MSVNVFSGTGLTITGTVSAVGAINAAISAAGNTPVPVTAASALPVSAAGGNIAVSAAGNTFNVRVSGNAPAAIRLSLATPLSSNGTDQPFEYVRINASAAGDTTLVAATASRSIRVLNYVISTQSAVSLQFQESDATPIVVGGPFDCADMGGVSFSGSLISPAFQCSVGKGLEIARAASAATVIGGHLTYVMVS